PGTGPDFDETLTAVSVPDSAFTETTRSTGTAMARPPTLVLTFGLATGSGESLLTTFSFRPGPSSGFDPSPEPQPAASRDTAVSAPINIAARARVVDIRLPVKVKKVRPNVTRHPRA